MKVKYIHATNDPDKLTINVKFTLPNDQYYMAEMFIEGFVGDSPSELADSLDVLSNDLRRIGDEVKNKKTVRPELHDPEVAVISSLCSIASRSGLSPWSLLPPTNDLAGKLSLEIKLCNFLLDNMGSFSFHFGRQWLLDEINRIKLRQLQHGFIDPPLIRVVFDDKKRKE